MTYRPLFVEVPIPPRCITLGCSRSSEVAGKQCEVCVLIDSMIEDLRPTDTVGEIIKDVEKAACDLAVSYSIVWDDILAALRRRWFRRRGSASSRTGA